MHELREHAELRHTDQRQCGKPYAATAVSRMIAA
jgi:hypothetical protein